MSQLVLDAGAFVGFERGDVRVRARILAARRMGIQPVTTSPVVAQVWRDGRRQALLAGLVAGTQIDAPSARAARRAGELLAKTKTADAVDALLVGVVGDGDLVLTSDPSDILRLLAAASIRATVVAV
jgi:uncharacterized protein YaiI (UPF0178 family)